MKPNTKPTRHFLVDFSLDGLFMSEVVEMDVEERNIKSALLQACGEGAVIYNFIEVD